MKSRKLNKSHSTWKSLSKSFSNWFENEITLTIFDSKIIEKLEELQSPNPFKHNDWVFINRNIKKLEAFQSPFIESISSKILQDWVFVYHESEENEEFVTPIYQHEESSEPSYNCVNCKKTFLNEMKYTHHLFRNCHKKNDMSNT